MDTTFGRRLMELRKAYRGVGITRKAFASLVKNESGKPVSDNRIFEIEHDQVRPTDFEVLQFAAIFELDEAEAVAFASLKKGPFQNPFSIELARLMHERWLTAADLARRTSAIKGKFSSDANCISDLLQGRCLPSRPMRAKLAIALGVEDSYLAALCGEPPHELTSYLMEWPSKAIELAWLFERALRDGFTTWTFIMGSDSTHTVPTTRLSVGEQLVEMREKLGLSHIHVARSAHISPQHWKDIERNRRALTPEIINRVATQLSTTTIALQAITGHPISQIVSYFEKYPSMAVVVNEFFARARAQGFHSWEKVLTASDGA